MRTKFYILASTALALACSAVGASCADMPRNVVKAPALGLFEASQLYYGLGTLGETTKASVSAPALGTTGDITTAGGGAGGIVGYHKGNVAKFWQVEAYAYRKNLGGSQLVTGADVTVPWEFGGRVKFGGAQTYANLMALLGDNLGLGGLGLSAGTGTGQNTMPYVYAGVNAAKSQASLLGVASASDWQVTPEVGIGAITRIMSPATGQPQGCAADASMGYSPAGKGFAIGDGVLGGGLANTGRSFKVRAAVLC